MARKLTLLVFLFSFCCLLPGSSHADDHAGFVAHYYEDEVAYWVGDALPTLVRLAAMIEELDGVDDDVSVRVFDGLQPAFDEAAFDRATAQQLVPSEIVQRHSTHRASGKSSWGALVRTLRDEYEQRDSRIEAGVSILDIDDRVAKTLADGLDLSKVSVAPIGGEGGALPPGERPAPCGDECAECEGRGVTEQALGKHVERALSEVTSGNESDCLPEPTQQRANPLDTSDTQVLWTAITTPFNTTNNNSCWALAMGACASKLGILGRHASGRIWNTLSQQVNAYAGGWESRMQQWYQARGYGMTVASDAGRLSACEEARNALQRGCDVLTYMADNNGGATHIEMVHTATVDNNDNERCRLSTLSWGATGTMTYDSGNLHNHTWYANQGTSTMYYFCRNN